MVASGGAGTVTSITSLAAPGGGLIGISGTSSNSNYNNSTYLATAATQKSGGTCYNAVGNGSFGTASQAYPTAWGGGGGGGYYGGATGHGGTGSSGSSFISGYAGVNAVKSASLTTATNNIMHYSNKYFINGSMTSGVNSGDGKAKITYLGNAKPIRTNTNLDNVRYIKDCTSGNNVNSASHWVEIQAIYDGLNVAYGIVDSTIPTYSDRPMTRISDGDITSEFYTQSTNATGIQCAVLDLKSNYNLDEIAVWHYWKDARIYKNKSISVSSDNSNWTTIFSDPNNTVQETSEGIRVSAYE